MKEAAVVFFGLAPSVSAVVAAGILALKKRSGWGWFLLAAILLVPTIKTS